jgi:hypothetical protein
MGLDSSGVRLFENINREFRLSEMPRKECEAVDFCDRLAKWLTLFECEDLPDLLGIRLRDIRHGFERRTTIRETRRSPEGKGNGGGIDCRVELRLGGPRAGCADFFCCGIQHIQATRAFLEPAIN